MTEENRSKKNKPGLEEEINEQIKSKIKEIEKFADLLISTNPDDIKCNLHEQQTSDCDECQRLRDKAEKYQTHKHTFTCAKKRKTITIKPNEGHGRLDGVIKGPELSNISVCSSLWMKPY